jgi:DnaJ-class molecular chaperone
MAEKHLCKACHGTGLLADDENWKYTCTVCGGDGILSPGESPEPEGLFSVDENNRVLE